MSHYDKIQPPALSMSPLSSYSQSPIDGTWQLIRAELDGEAAPELVVTQTVLALAAGAYEVRFAGEIADRGSFELCETAEANSIILRGTDGPNAGRSIPCIYQLAGGRLRICYGLDGVAPTQFATSTGQQRYLAIYRRDETPL